MLATHLKVWLLLALAMVQEHASPRNSHAAAGLARPLLTGYENLRSAPLGPGGELVARTRAEWDSGWKALELPGTPPPVDFTREIAALRADYFGGSPYSYASGVDSARRSRKGSIITVYAHVHDPQGGVDTASRKVLATALRIAPSARVTVRWRFTR